MPKFLDYHETMPPMPPEATQAEQEQIRSGKPDEFGVVPLNAIVGDGHAWCLTEAPAPMRSANLTRPRVFPKMAETHLRYRA